MSPAADTDTIAAIVAIEAATFAEADDCAPSEPVATLQVHGTSDTTVANDGGTFAGELANKAHDQITVAQLYSFLPTEIKAQLLSLADSLGGDDEGDGEGDGEPGEEPTPIPDGLTAKQYVDQLSAEAGRLGAAGDIAGWLETIQLMFKVIGENVGDLIDISEVTALLNDVFQPNPEIVTLTQGIP